MNPSIGFENIRVQFFCRNWAWQELNTFEIEKKNSNVLKTITGFPWFLPTVSCLYNYMFSAICIVIFLNNKKDIKKQQGHLALIRSLESIASLFSDPLMAKLNMGSWSANFEPRTIISSRRCPLDNVSWQIFKY